MPTKTNNQTQNLSNASNKSNVVKKRRSPSNIYRLSSTEISNRYEKDARYRIVVPDTRKCKLNDSIEFAKKDKSEITISSTAKKTMAVFLVKLI